ncbi:hypothetical protein GCM10025868_14970 [Angustibacter aerolatus]|uniref:BPP domain-containing protein n=1 Tax=Angustibacter aerolatus TaxID=1162965 RepID=A0ABQ6JDI1_9ACTN|nr:hypothetical protein GCM10025868_14970 [Angustibacter aerolatus]
MTGTASVVVLLSWWSFSRTDSLGGPAVPIPGFPDDAVDEHGFPRWIAHLGDMNSNHLLHVVRGLSPEPALRLVGGGEEVRHLEPGSLAADGGEDGGSRVHAAVGAHRRADLLIAGTRGDWTFVYDPTGQTFEAAEGLSAEDRLAVSATSSISATASLQARGGR